MEINQTPSDQNPLISQPSTRQNGASSTRLFTVSVVSVLATAVLVGFAVYFFQESASEQVISELEEKVISLENQLSIVQETETPAPSPSTTTGSIADWNTYLNTEYGFTVKYPKALKTQPVASGVEVREAPQDSPNFYIYDPKDDGSYVNRYVSFQVLGLEPSYSDNYTRSEVMFGDASAIKLVPSAEPGPFDIYLIEFSDNQGVVEVYVSNSEDREAIADQILSTFQFTE
jgi:hypothetical protein